jgi:hypothetical protein
MAPDRRTGSVLLAGFGLQVSEVLSSLVTIPGLPAKIMPKVPTAVKTQAAKQKSGSLVIMKLEHAEKRVIIPRPKSYEVYRQVHPRAFLAT